MNHQQAVLLLVSPQVLFPMGLTHQDLLRMRTQRLHLPCKAHSKHHTGMLLLQRAGEIVVHTVFECQKVVGSIPNSVIGSFH